MKAKLLAAIQEKKSNSVPEDAGDEQNTVDVEVIEEFMSIADGQVSALGSCCRWNWLSNICPTFSSAVWIRAIQGFLMQRSFYVHLFGLLILILFFVSLPSQSGAVNYSQ